MKKTIDILFVLCAFASIVSCAAFQKTKEQTTLYNAFVLSENDDISGHHINSEMLVFQDALGVLGDTVFRAYIGKETVDGKATRYYWHFKAQTMRNITDYNLELFPKMRIDDGEVVDLNNSVIVPEWKSTASVFVEENNHTIYSGDVEKMKNANSIVLQFYEKSKSLQVSKLSDEAIVHLKDFLNK